MDWISIRRVPATLFLAALFLAPLPLAAQQFPGLGGIEARVGFASPDDIGSGLSAGVDVNLGYIGITMLRTVVGSNYFSADVKDRSFGDRPVSGSLAGVGGRAGLRLDLLGGAGISPSVSAMLTGHRVTVDAPLEQDRADLDREFGGVLVGISLGAGVSYAMDEERRFRAVLEARRAMMSNTPHWAAEAGVRIMVRGRDAYSRVARYQEPSVVSIERAAGEAERLRVEQQRAEAERLRVEQQRREAEQAQQRAEEERLLRMSDAERDAARRETEEARRRAAEAEAAALRAAAGREAAERDAERLRAEGAAAERRAREAEERLYRSLLDLERLITNITEIRETERGLVVVLGQGIFGVGQHSLSARARDEIGPIAAVLRQYEAHRISVEGHTDSTGSEVLNQRLSEQRADAVRAALLAEGIEPSRVGTIGHGQHRPIADNTTATGRGQNRRVEMVLLGARRPTTTN